MEHFSTRDLIVETANKLFVYTDMQNWDKLKSEVFTEEVLFDMTSVGGEKRMMTAKEICDTWQKGFEGIDQVNHLAGNYLVTIDGKNATVFAYATATHYKRSAQNGPREFVGTYDLNMVFEDSGWRIDQFRYNLKYMSGNLDLK